jgi:hypothetical protein
MEENNISINDKELEAISAGGASSLDGSIDFTSISFEEYLTEINFPGREDFPLPEFYDSTILALDGIFKQLQTMAFSVNKLERGSGE